ncbi:hypothetical protein MMC29_004448, partial [Sticta canariensis]|nr:hypothetical protein [Sticta canariensis]
KKEISYIIAILDHILIKGMKKNDVIHSGHNFHVQISPSSDLFHSRLNTIAEPVLTGKMNPATPSCQSAGARPEHRMTATTTSQRAGASPMARGTPVAIEVAEILRVRGGEDGKRDESEPLDGAGIAEQAASAAAAEDENLQRPGQEACKADAIEEIFENGAFGSAPFIVPETGDHLHETGSEPSQVHAGKDRDRIDGVHQPCGLGGRQSLGWQWSPGLVDAVFLDRFWVSLIVNVEQQEIGPRPDKHGWCLAKNLEQAHAFAESEYRTTHCTKNTKGIPKNHDVFQIIACKKVKRISMIEQRARIVWSA